MLDERSGSIIMERITSMKNLLPPTNGNGSRSPENPRSVDPETMAVTTPGPDSAPFPEIQKFLEKWDETYKLTGTSITIMDFEEFRQIYLLYSFLDDGSARLLPSSTVTR